MATGQDDDYYRSMGQRQLSLDSLSAEPKPSPMSSRSDSPYYNAYVAAPPVPVPHKQKDRPHYDSPTGHTTPPPGALGYSHPVSPAKFSYINPDLAAAIKPKVIYGRSLDAPEPKALSHNGSSLGRQPYYSPAAGSQGQNLDQDGYEKPVPPLTDTVDTDLDSAVDDIKLPTRAGAPDVPSRAKDRQKTRLEVQYSVSSTPPWYITLVLAVQNILIMYGATVAIVLVLAEPLCVRNDNVALGQILSTMWVISGIATLLQTTFGVRLPVIQGGTFSFVYPTFAILNSPEWKCPTNSTLATVHTLATMHPELLNNVTASSMPMAEEAPWLPRMREIQGAIMVASLFQVLIGLTGAMGFMMRYIGPLAVCPTISLIGLSLFDTAVAFSQSQWWITLVTVILIIAFSQYSRNIEIPCFHFERGKGCLKTKVPVFRLFPVILAVLLSWGITLILTATRVLPSPPGRPWTLGNDTRVLDIVDHTPWFSVPYPGQWGRPTVSAAAVFGMLSGVLASMTESVGDYYACARMAGVPPPPMHAINRGIGVEGIACIIAGAFGTGNGTTSYSENIGAIGITKVASRVVIQVSAVVMILCGVFGKLGAIFLVIPDPIIGGVFIVMFGMIAAVGMSNLQFVDLNSSRNLFILGFSFFFGLTLPKYLNDNPDAIKTGSDAADQIFSTLFRTNMFVGGFAGFILDNTIPGTDRERGLIKWREQLIPKKRRRQEANEPGLDNYVTTQNTYDLPLITSWLTKHSWTKYVPFLPTFNEDYLSPKKHIQKRRKKSLPKRSNSVNCNEAENQV